MTVTTNTQTAGGTAGGGSSTYAGLSDAATASLPTINTPLATALANPGGSIYVPLTGVAATDFPAINAATLAASVNGGTVIIGPGTSTMSSTSHRILIYPGITILGQGVSGTRLIAPAGAGTSAMFSFEGTGVNVVSFTLDRIWLQGYSSDWQGLNTKVSTGNLWDVHIGRDVYFDGFGNGNATNTNAVVQIGDPWGLRFNAIIEQSGDRPALNIAANGSSVANAVVQTAKITNNAGPAIVATGTTGLVVQSCILGTTGNSRVIATLTNCSGSIVSQNYVWGVGSSSTGQVGLDLTGTTNGTLSRGNVYDGQGSLTSVGVRTGSSCTLNTFDDEVKNWVTPFTDNAGDSTYLFLTPGAEINSNSRSIGLVATRYYKPHYFVGANATLAFPSVNLVYLIPFYVPEHTTFTRIGIRVMIGIAASNVRLGIYRCSAGLPTTLVSGSDVGNVASATSTADVESTISCLLPRGWVFLAVQPSAAITVMSQTASSQSYLAGDTTSSGLENFMYLSPGSFGALASTAGSVTYSGALVGNNPAMWLRRS